MIKKEYLLGGFVSRKITTRAMGKKQNVNQIFMIHLIKHDTCTVAELWQVSDRGEENELVMLCSAQWQEVACL